MHAGNERLKLDKKSRMFRIRSLIRVTPVRFNVGKIYKGKLNCDKKAKRVYYENDVIFRPKILTMLRKIKNNNNCHWGIPNLFIYFFIFAEISILSSFYSFHIWFRGI